jgi:ribosome modulation factor
MGILTGLFRLGLDARTQSRQQAGTEIVRFVERECPEEDVDGNGCAATRGCVAGEGGKSDEIGGPYTGIDVPYTLQNAWKDAGEETLAVKDLSCAPKVNQ